MRDMPIATPSATPVTAATRNPAKMRSSVTPR
jgi:hypothetical protein